MWRLHVSKSCEDERNIHYAKNSWSFREKSEDFEVKSENPKILIFKGKIGRFQEKSEDLEGL